MSTWWNQNYLFRRAIKIIPKVSAGHPVHIIFSRAKYLSLNKMRSDNNDLEIVYSLDAATPSTHTVIPFKDISAPAAEYAELVFNVVDDIATTSYDYYLYFNNPALTSQPVSGVFVESDYVISLTPVQYTSNLTFSRPTEDWDIGFSDRVNARAALTFIGPYARFRVEKGPDRGIIEVILDNNPPSYVDTYNYETKIETAYVTSGLDLTQHYLRLRVTGDKHPSSSNYGVKLVSFDFSNYVQGELLEEEILSTALPVRIIVGP